MRVIFVTEMHTLTLKNYFIIKADASSERCISYMISSRITTIVHYLCYNSVVCAKIYSP